MPAAPKAADTWEPDKTPALPAPQVPSKILALANVKLTRPLPHSPSLELVPSPPTLMPLSSVLHSLHHRSLPLLAIVPHANSTPMPMSRLHLRSPCDVSLRQPSQFPSHVRGSSHSPRTPVLFHYSDYDNHCRSVFSSQHSSPIRPTTLYERHQLRYSQHPPWYPD